MRKLTAILGSFLLVVSFATPAQSVDEYTVRQKTLATFSSNATTLTSQQRAQVKATVDANPAAEKFICTGIRFYSQPMSVNIIVAKRAKAACEYAKDLNPALSTWFQSKPTQARSYAGKVLLTAKSPALASESKDGSTESEPSSSSDPTPVAQSNQGSAGELTAMIRLLEVESEYVSGYDRTLFKHWIDEDGNGCDARKEVLIQESVTPVTKGASCTLFGGSWVSAFDLEETTDSSSFDVDHMVPLKEAWDSGAWMWSSSTRQAFANDLGYDHSLIAVSSSSNRSKSDRDPADWLPSNVDFRCEYTVAWVQVKIRWKLSVDVAEKGKLVSLASSCGDEPLEFAPKAKATSEATPTPEAEAVSGTVSPGAFCKASDAGKRGVGSNGVTYTCKTSATDSRLRWRR